jgi:hypothetical protein
MGNHVEPQTQRRRLDPNPNDRYRSTIKFLYETTLQRPWLVLVLMRPRKRHKLPVVFSPQDARDLSPSSTARYTHRSNATLPSGCAIAHYLTGSQTSYPATIPQMLAVGVANAEKSCRRLKVVVGW